MYPFFHPDRPYFVNLAYLYGDILRQINNEFFQIKWHYEILDGVQKHYLKYLELYGPEEKLPGFLMTNQQMIEFIFSQFYLIYKKLPQK